MQNGREDGARRARPPLEVVFRQDAMRRRTRLQRGLAHARRPVLLALTVMLIVAATCTGIAVGYVEHAMHPPRRPHAAGAAAQASTFAARHDASLAPAVVVGTDGAVLRGWWLAPRHQSLASVILLHGFGDNREAMLPLAGVLLDRHVRVLLPDLRAHGSSGGREVTWGVLEAADMAMWADWIEQRHAGLCVSAFGSSLGGGIVLQALSRASLCAAVVEAPFESFVARASHDLGDWTRVPPALADLAAAPLVELSLLYARVRYGIDLRRADARPPLARSRTPVLVIEDGADDTMRSGTADRLASMNSRMISTWTASGAAHAAAWQAHPREFPDRVIAFLERHR